MPGRPTKLTPELEKRLLDAIKVGNFRSAACRYVGIAKSTLRLWLAQGRAHPKGRMGDFRRRVMEAEKSAEIRCVALIHQAATKDWKAAAWFLERKVPAWRKEQERPVEYVDRTQVAILIDASGKTQAELADAAGISKPKFSRWMKGRARLSQDEAFALERQMASVQALPARGQTVDAEVVGKSEDSEGVQAEARRQTETAIRACAAILASARSEAARLRAAEILLSYGYGKPVQHVPKQETKAPVEDHELLEALGRLTRAKKEAADAEPP